MKFEELSLDAQNVISLGCRMLGRDLEAFFDGLRAEFMGSEKMLYGWKEIGPILGLSPSGARRRAETDALLNAILMKDCRMVVARKSDVEKYRELKLKSRAFAR